MAANELGSQVLFSVGPLHVTVTVVTTWAVMAALTLAAWLLTRNLRIGPGDRQTAVEGVVVAIEEAIRAVAPDHAERIQPFVATLWIYLAVANLVGLIPEASSPNRDISATAALAILVFLSVHWFGIRALGLRQYLKHYLSPSPILLPFHIIGEITRTIALAIRLFGNIMSLEIAAALVLLVAGFLAPIPILMLHIVEALVQAYIFGTLALIYLAGAMQSQHQSEESKE
ncbi:F0F1 ATP synthase subunit A [Methylogaea oryzae]|uniref:ATP synthase subunit a n=1 Tax=Methylogaea oryzae TaxID=1295382 RepID=A0A8D4VU77_9GAMM|nr:F0F1 ATP synthase subunit A [Methylogaea oryzae]BBL72370.1 ATP synthase subunit a [Methylogaea oryzae]